MGDTQYCGEYHDVRGGYHEYRGGVQYRGEINLLLFEYPTVPMISPTYIMISPHGTQVTKDGILHGTHDIPHVPS